MILGNRQGGTQIGVLGVLVFQKIKTGREMGFYQKMINHNVFLSFLKGKASQFVEFITASFVP